MSEKYQNTEQVARYTYQRTHKLQIRYTTVNDYLQHIPIKNQKSFSIDLATEKLTKSINDKLKKSQKKDIYIYVPGYRVGFEDPVMIAAQLWHYIGYDGVFIAYSWPTTPKRLLAYVSDLENATNTIRKFRILLEFLASNTEVNQINIIGHSAGTILFLEIVNLFGSLVKVL